MRFERHLLAGILALAVATTAEAASLSPNEYTNSPQLALIGVTPALQASANYGTGIIFGVIDTGGLARQIEFGGRIDTAKSACLIRNCPKARATTDDNGHGTFVTSELIAGANGFGIVGVAPRAKAIEMKVLGANGSGTVADVARGIRLAVDSGARILNLSLTFLPTTDIVSALNYAASKNAVVVFAGGNSAQSFMNNGIVTGFTDAAIQRMFFMGSTNASKTVSTFSNRPGTGGFRSTTGVFYAFKDDWLMAPGENIWGASNFCSAQLGCAFYTQMSGTSMAAPLGAGAVGLIAARWPFLLNTPNQIVQILMQTAEDLGVRGHDAIYGAGFLRVDRAFQPIGQLTVPTSSGATTPTSGTGLATSRPFGRLRKFSAALAGAAAFDDFHRDFLVNFDGAILARSSASVAAAAALQTAPGLDRQIAFADGSVMSLAAGMGEDRRSRVFGGPVGPASPFSPKRSLWSMSFVGAGENAGTYFAAGEGGNAAQSFDAARWSGGSAFSGGDASASGALLGLVAQSRYTALGFDVGAGSRLALATLAGEDTALSPLGRAASARGVAASYTFASASRRWQVSLSAAMLDEKGMLLGAPATGALSLGDGTSYSAGVAANFDLGQGYRLGFDAVEVTTGARSSARGIVSRISRLTARGFGAALSKTGLARPGDEFTLTLKKPLGVTSGSAVLDIATGNDLDGNAVFARRRASLAADGSETAFGAGYAAPLLPGVSASLYAGLRLDADNVAGRREAGTVLRLQASF